MDYEENPQVRIEDAQRRNADALFPLLFQRIRDLSEQNKKIIAVSGGSGVGKTGMAWLLRERFLADGIPAMILSGDHYPRRIPFYNDAERLRIFRAAGLKGLLTEKLYDAAVRDELKKLQEENRDAEELAEYPWLAVYHKWGEAALAQYLGSEEELLFSEVCNVLAAFKGGEKTLMLRQMGRKEHEIWYEEVKTDKINVLILEWTHGNSPLLAGAGIDASIVLKSTPEETLENRKRRNRDAGVESPFVARVLKIEQKMIDESLSRADLIQDMGGNIQIRDEKGR